MVSQINNYFIYYALNFDPNFGQNGAKCVHSQLQQAIISYDPNNILNLHQKLTKKKNQEKYIDVLRHGQCLNMALSQTIPEFSVVPLEDIKYTKRSLIYWNSKNNAQSVNSSLLHVLQYSVIFKPITTFDSLLFQTRRYI